MTGVRPSRVLGALHADLGRGDHKSSVFLAGSGRSGTTWVSAVINHQGAYRLVFEPFHPGKVRMMRGFRRRQYLRPGDRREEEGVAQQRERDPGRRAAEAGGASAQVGFD